MAHGRTVTFRFAAPCLLVATATLSGCGIQIQTLAQSPLVPAASATPFGPAESSSHIFTPCIAAVAEPLVSAASAVSELLLGKDQFRTECAHAPEPILRFDTVERDAQVLTPQPAASDPAAPGLMVTDELVGAVLTGTGEYWYQPVIGPA